jgi:pilus assembly protein Flp/PilA
VPTRNALTLKLRRFLRQQQGATAIEYALIAAGIAMAIIVTVKALGGAVLGLWNSVSNVL